MKYYVSVLYEQKGKKVGNLKHGKITRQQDIKVIYFLLAQPQIERSFKQHGILAHHITWNTGFNSTTY